MKEIRTVGEMVEQLKKIPKELIIQGTITQSASFLPLNVTKINLLVQVPGISVTITGGTVSLTFQLASAKRIENDYLKLKSKYEKEVKRRAHKKSRSV